MVNKWVEHIRAWANMMNTTYSCALADPQCLKDYKNPPEELKPKKSRKPKMATVLNVPKKRGRKPKVVLP